MTADRPPGRTAPQNTTQKLTPKECELYNRLDKRFKRYEDDPLMMFIKKTAFKKLLARMRNAS